MKNTRRAVLKKKRTENTLFAVIHSPFTILWYVLLTLLVTGSSVQKAFAEDPAPEIPIPPLWGAPRPLVIVKTNLLYDVALMPHIGVEVPIGERFSVGAEFMRGWWLKRDWSFCWQLEAATLEGRYWFSPHTERYLRGGWFAGIFAQAGFYDFQLNSTSGVQGECMMAGVSGGYLYPLGGNWSLEFTLGVGYLRTNYRRYTVETIHNDEHELVKSAASMRLRGVYPLKAGISLQWAIGRKGGK